MACAQEGQLAWFRQLGRTARQAVGLVKPDGQSEPLQRCCKSAAQAPWKSFELADAMEQGLAMELTTGFVTPLKSEEPARRLAVTQSENGGEHILWSETDEPLLLARNSADGTRVDIYIPTGGDPPLALGPAFTLHRENDERYKLVSERCECCEYLPPAHACFKRGKQVLAYIQHSRPQVGRGVAMCMRVELPEIRLDGTPAVWCAESGGSCSDNKLCLESRLPAWSKKVKALVLDFFGRVTCTSSQNFQLQLPEREAGNDNDRQVELLFGKTADRTFALDYRHPLGMVQAFAIALSTSTW